MANKTEVIHWARLVEGLVRSAHPYCKSQGNPPCGNRCECWQHSLAVAEVTCWLAEDPLNVRRLAAMYAVCKAAKSTFKVGGITDPKGGSPQYSYQDNGQMWDATVKLARLEQDLGSAYQSIMDGRM